MCVLLNLLMWKAFRDFRRLICAECYVLLSHGLLKKCQRSWIFICIDWHVIYLLQKGLYHSHLGRECQTRGSHRKNLTERQRLIHIHIHINTQRDGVWQALRGLIRVGLGDDEAHSWVHCSPKRGGSPLHWWLWSRDWGAVREVIVIGCDSGGLTAGSSLAPVLVLQQTD